MKLAQRAFVARSAGNSQAARELAQQALNYEQEAAYSVDRKEAAEPTRSILFRSAASLALQSGDLRQAQRLIAEGLAGYPPPRVEKELKDLFEQVNLESHLSVLGIELKEDEFQLSLAGNAIGSGMILYGEFRERLDAVIGQIPRTVQRIVNAPYHSRGRPPKEYRLFTPALSMPRGNSFATTIRLAVQKGVQLNLMVDATSVIDNIIRGLELINHGAEAELNEFIPDRAYRTNFISFAKTIAPDGDMVTLVGLTSEKTSVGFTREAGEITLGQPGLDLTQDLKLERENVLIKGVFDFAKFRRSNIIGLTTTEGKSYDVEVEEGMDDFVRQHFNFTVEIAGVYDGKRVYPDPDGIRRVEDDL